MRKFPPNHRSYLRNLLSRPEPIKSRHQRSVQASGNCDGGRRNGTHGAFGRTFSKRLQHRLGHFLDEQRNAIGTLDNVLSNTTQQWLVAADTVDQVSDFALAEAIETECGDVGRPTQGGSNSGRYVMTSSTPRVLS